MMDVILFIDGCPKGGKKLWDAQIKSAKQFVSSFNPKKAQIAVISFCGPRTWSGVSKCTGKSTKKIDTEKVCKVKIASHFSDDMKKVKGVINGITYAKGTKLVSMALLSAKSELTLGRKDAHSIVLAF